MQTNPDTPTKRQNPHLWVLLFYILIEPAICSAFAFKVMRILNREGMWLEYFVHYSPQYDKKYPLKLKKVSRPVRVWIAVFVIAAAILGFKYRETFRQWMLMAGADSAHQAVSVFVDDIKDGKSFKDAATAFCFEILKNAQIEFTDPV